LPAHWHSSLSRCHLAGKGHPSQPTLSPPEGKKKKEGTYANFIPKHALNKKALTECMYSEFQNFAAFIALTIFDLLAFNRIII